ncbi:Uncharacterised protein [Yersinia intermedia]|nr:Uncharacterised protein [Yersinia intermedia]
MSASISNSNSNRSISNTPTHQLRKNELHQQKNTLCASIQKVGNVLTELNRKINVETNNLNKNDAFLKSLKGIASKHGDDANIRFKNGHFKHGQGSNFLKNLLNGGRYKLEQQAAATQLVVKGSEVSARTGISTFTQKIKTINESLDSSKGELKEKKAELGKLNANLNDVDKNIANVNKIAFAAEKENAGRKDFLNKFATLYQTNVGSKVMNATARFQSGRSEFNSFELKGKEVIAEYEQTHNASIFNGGNKDLPSIIKSLCGDNLPIMVRKATEVLYTPSDVTTKSYRAQGMTSDGINTLINQFNANNKGKEETVYRVGQFFSTTKDVNKTDKFFEHQIQDNIKVMFEIKGNSGSGILVSNGLAFNEGEKELIYSPLANFKVTAITKNPNNIRGDYTIKLQEAERNDKSDFIPY